MEKSDDKEEEKEESVSDELVEEEIPAGALADDTEASDEEALKRSGEEIGINQAIYCQDGVVNIEFYR